jgi:DnaJ family protein C protein 28
MSSIEEEDAVERWAKGSDQPNEPVEESKRSRLPGYVTAWDSLVERRIKEAQEQGLFDDLPGKGEPLDLSENPFLDPSWRVAYKLLQDHGFAPEWIELDKEIRIELEMLRRQLAETKRWYDEAIAALQGKTGHETQEERAWVEVYWERRLNALAARAGELNEKIELFNLKVPIANLQRRRISIEKELRRLDLE